MEEPRSPLLIALTATATVVVLVVFVLYSKRCGGGLDDQGGGKDASAFGSLGSKKGDFTTGDSQDIDSVAMEQLGASLRFSASQQLMDEIVDIANQQNAGDQYKRLAGLIGKEALSDEKQERLLDLIYKHGLTLDGDDPSQVIGLLEQGKQVRWALNLEEKEQIIFELRKQADGHWAIEDIELPRRKLSSDLSGSYDKALGAIGEASGKESATENGKGGLAKGAEEPERQRDALDCAHHFVTHVLAQRFEAAKELVESQKVSDASIAGLCILFEEGKYQLHRQKPLRAVYNRDLVAGFIASLVSENGSEDAEFSLLLQRESAQSKWKIHEINLDKLIQDYAQRVAGGDVYYTPLANHPQGGQTLVIYFEFDQQDLTERNKRQLQIVSELLKLDANKSIVISGHTDAKGSASYNQTLSSRRANAVIDYLASLGVKESQIRKEAHGMNQPRRPNTLDDGRDDPSGRRANRRTEIYLDF